MFYAPNPLGENSILFGSHSLNHGTQLNYNRADVATDLSTALDDALVSLVIPRQPDADEAPGRD